MTGRARAALAGVALIVAVHRGTTRLERDLAVRPRRPTRRPQTLLVVVLVVGGLAFVRHATVDGPVPMESTPVADAQDVRIVNVNTLTSATNCATATPYVDTQTVAPLTITDASPTTTLTTKYLCVRNAGPDPAVMRLELFNTVQTETGCTGDEPTFDPDGPGCGTAGELADDVNVTVAQRGPGATSSVGCAETAQSPARSFVGVADTAAQTIGGSIPAGGFACYRIDANYRPGFTDPTAVEIVTNQTDRVSWQFRISGSDT